MAKRFDLYSTYGQFTKEVLQTIRKETFGQDIGQNSWITAEEYDRFISWLDLTREHHVLEMASGSGGPALYLAKRVGCKVTGIDADERAVATATQSAAKSGQTDRVNFKLADANVRLPFADESIDAILCIDSMNHFLNRLGVFQEWHRVLRPGRRAVFTDPVVITGPVTSEELARRSSIGLFLFVPARHQRATHRKRRISPDQAGRRDQKRGLAFRAVARAAPAPQGSIAENRRRRALHRSATILQHRAPAHERETIIESGLSGGKARPLGHIITQSLPL